MPQLDVAMPLALLTVVIVALFLNKRVEGKLMRTVEKKQFKTRDVVLLVVFIAVMISVIAYTTLVSPGAVLQNILIVVFLSSYTMLLFTFSYIFSNLSPRKAMINSVAFGVASSVAAAACTFWPLVDSYTPLRVAAFAGLAFFCFGAAVYEHFKGAVKPRWYIAAQPPAIFILLFVFFNYLHNMGTQYVWTPYLMDVFGFTFAILIIVYLSSLFSWKTVGIFAVLLTILDIILVIGTGTMVAAAKQFTGLGLPVLVFLPNVPLLVSSTGELQFRGLGLGDFFFAGVLAVQTYKKFGKKTAFASIVAMSVAFGIWEAFLHDILALLNPLLGREIGGFPGTLMIISGWAPIVAIALISRRGKKQGVALTENAPLAPEAHNPQTN